MTLKPREIWEKGTSLDDAWYAWSNEEQREAYDALGSYSPPQPIAELFVELRACRKAVVV